MAAPRKGFTLIELLVALTICTAVVGVLIGSIFSGFRLWGRMFCRVATIEPLLH